MIKDSGARREFESGAVRDIQEGKGRMDLVPLDVMSELIDDDIIYEVNRALELKNEEPLFDALDAFAAKYFKDMETMIIEVSIHYEEGCSKYDP